MVQKYPVVRPMAVRPVENSAVPLGLLQARLGHPGWTPSGLPRSEREARSGQRPGQDASVSGTAWTMNQLSMSAPREWTIFVVISLWV